MWEGHRHSKDHPGEKGPELWWRINSDHVPVPDYDFAYEVHAEGLGILSLNELPGLFFFAQNTTKRQCKNGIASWQLSPTVTSSCSMVNSTEALVACCCSAPEGQEWEIPTSAQSISCNAVMFRALSRALTWCQEQKASSWLSPLHVRHWQPQYNRWRN